MFGFLPAPCSTCVPGSRSVYQAHFCGLSNQLASDYGVATRFLTNRDSTFVGLLASACAEDETDQISKTCCNPFGKKRDMVSGQAMQFAAAVTVCGLSAKLDDNANDERGVKRWGSGLTRSAIEAKVVKATAILDGGNFPTGEVRERLAEQADLEKQGASWEQVAEPSAFAFSKILGHSISGWNAALGSAGFHLGRLIYLLDAVEDREQDIKQKRFNPLAKYSGMEAAKDWAFTEIDRIKTVFDALPLKRYEPIVEAILITGVESKMQEVFALPATNRKQKS
ncbi:MAG: DUF5685 family protein, partial [Verrucomicrobiota bacterium]